MRSGGLNSLYARDVASVLEVLYSLFILLNCYFKTIITYYMTFNSRYD